MLEAICLTSSPNLSLSTRAHLFQAKKEKIFSLFSTGVFLKINQK